MLPATFRRIETNVPGKVRFVKRFRYKSRDDRPKSPKSGMWIFKTSNGSKIARVAPISTIFGRNQSRRPKLFFQTISRRRNNLSVNGNIAANKRRTNDGQTNERTNEKIAPRPFCYKSVRRVQNINAHMDTQDDPEVYVLLLDLPLQVFNHMTVYFLFFRQKSTHGKFVRRFREVFRSFHRCGNLFAGVQN